MADNGVWANVLNATTFGICSFVFVTNGYWYLLFITVPLGLLSILLVWAFMTAPKAIRKGDTDE